MSSTSVEVRNIVSFTLTVEDLIAYLTVMKIMMIINPI